jgi:4-amino-4-deoxy-L-arabinose transferase-like glycosyltransferase
VSNHQIGIGGGFVDPRQPPAGRIILIIAMLVFGLYSIIPTKLQWYVAPLYPALALLIARTLSVAWTDARSLEFKGRAGLEPDFAVGILGEAGPYLLAEIRRNTAR